MSQSKFALDTSKLKPASEEAQMINTTVGEFAYEDPSMLWAFKLIDLIANRQEAGKQKEVMDKMEQLIEACLDGITKQQVSEMSTHEKDALYFGLQKIVLERFESVRNVSELAKTKARG